MTVAVNYYELLGVAGEASENDIKEAHKRQVNRWTRRAASSDMNVRQEAENTVKWLREAHDILLDSEQRKTYDRTLKERSPAGSAPQTGLGASGSWLDKSRQYLSVNDYHSAAYAAREAVREVGSTAEAWVILSRAHAGLGKLDEALYEAKQAVELREDSDEYHFHLGGVYEGLEKWSAAIEEYTVAGRLNPSVPIYELSIASVFLQHGKYDEALSRVKAVHSRFPNDDTVKYVYAETLIELAEAVPVRQDKDGYTVTSKVEITKMRTLLEQASALEVKEPVVVNGIKETTAYLDDMEKKKFSVPSAFFAPLAIADGGCFATLVAAGMASAMLFLPLILLVVALSQMSSGSGASGFLLLLIAAGVGYGWWVMFWVPKWKAAARRS